MRGVSTRTKQWKKGESPRGTAAYIPPERYSDRGPAAHSSLELDKKHDVYRLVWSMLPLVEYSGYTSGNIALV